MNDMNNRKFTIGLFASFLLMNSLSSCEHKIHEGRVIEKQHEDPRTYTYTTFIMSGKVTIPVVHTGYDDEDWVLVVMGIKGEDTIIENFYVSESNWKCIENGDIFNDSISCSIDDDGEHE